MLLFVFGISQKIQKPQWELLFHTVTLHIYMSNYVGKKQQQQQPKLPM